MADVQELEALGVKSGIIESLYGSKVFYYQRGIKMNNLSTHANQDLPILILLHGYPQSSFIWRHIIPLLPKNMPLFVADLPGYGRSKATLSSHSDKRSIGKAVLSALFHLISAENGGDIKQSVIIAGHDRGAHIAQRLAKDFAITPSPLTEVSGLSLLGTIVMDVIPISMQWSFFSNSRVSEGLFHWPFLARLDVALPMIKAWGGDNFCLWCIENWKGQNSNMNTNGAYEIYNNYFKEDGVIKASCEDYRAGAEDDLDMENEDKKAGRKIETPLCVIYSDYIGKRIDVKGAWSGWVSDEGLLECVNVGPVGHFSPEEAPEATARFMNKFLEKIMEPRQ